MGNKIYMLAALIIVFRKVLQCNQQHFEPVLTLNVRS